MDVFVFGADDSATIEHLPTELLINIFQFLPPNEWKAPRAVCKRWLEILSDLGSCKKLPLVIDNCTIQPGTEPLSVFLEAPKQHTFPFVEVGKVHYEPKNKLAYMKMFEKIGRHTIDLTLLSKMEENILVKFPRLKQLRLKKISDVSMCKAAPKSLKSVHVKYIDNPLSKALIKNMKTQLKELTATWISIKDEFCVDLSKRFREVIAEYSWVKGPFSTDKNLLCGKPIEVEEVTKLKISGSIEDYTVLKEFKNLDELYIRYIISDDDEEDVIDNTLCIHFHDNLDLTKVRKLWLKVHKELCVECFNTILNSFPKIENLELVTAVSTDQFCKIVEKYPKLKSLKLFCGNMERHVFRSKEGSKDKTNQTLGDLSYLESLVIIDNSDYYPKSVQPLENPIFVNDDVILNWPTMPRLKHLDLGLVVRELKRARSVPRYNFFDPNHEVGLNSIISRCPNVTEFSVRASSFSIADISQIAEGWPRLRQLSLELTDTAYLSDHQTRMIGVKCKQLKTLTITSLRQLRPDDDLFWQFQLYTLIPALRVIDVKDRTNNFNIGTTRRDWYAKQTVEEILYFGKERALERDMYEQYCSDEADSDEESNDDDDDEDEDDDGVEEYEQRFMIFVAMQLGLNFVVDDD